ncbi:MAG TPA: hypothetical protein VGO93_05525 [Candidatus Xenobia bacterium]|jgi:hypothetical protein
MNTLHRSLFRLCAGPPSSDRVPDTLLAALKQHGMSTPIRGLHDPRLDYPELLLIDGWDRQDPPAGCLFSYTSAGDPGPGNERWQQGYQVGRDGGCVLTTRCGHTESVIRKDAQGKINTSYRMV